MLLAAYIIRFAQPPTTVCLCTDHTLCRALREDFELHRDTDRSDTPHFSKFGTLWVRTAIWAFMPVWSLLSSMSGPDRFHHHLQFQSTKKACTVQGCPSFQKVVWTLVVLTLRVVSRSRVWRASRDEGDMHGCRKRFGGPFPVPKRFHPNEGPNSRHSL